MARLDAIHHLILPATTVIGPASPVFPPGTKPVQVVIKKAVVPGKQPVSSFAVHVQKPTAHDVALSQIQVPKRKRG